MKKLAASLLGICSMVASVHAQGTFIIDNSANGGNGSTANATTGGLVWLVDNPIEPILDTTTDISMQLYWGTSPGSIVNALNMDPTGLNSPTSTAWLANQATGQTDISFLGNGTFIDPNGNTYVLPGEAVGTEIFFTIQAWTGMSTTYAGVTGFGLNAGLVGQTSGSLTLAANTAVPPADVRSMGALVLIPGPEPSLPALSGLAAAAFALVRRKK